MASPKHNPNLHPSSVLTLSTDPDALAMDHMTRARLVVQLESMLDIERRKRKALENHVQDSVSYSIYSFVYYFNSGS